MYRQTVATLPERGGITAPRGFRSAGVHCGIKRSKPDLALIVSDVPASGAAVFTLNKVQAAPVLLSKDHLAKRSTFRAIVVNSGNANACTGQHGYADAVAMAETTAAALEILPSEVFVASTGVIGQRLPIEKIKQGIVSASSALTPAGQESAAMAIMTTDTRRKVASATFELDDVPVILSGMAKGSGMIHPNMATMLCFVTTDACIESPVLQNLLGEKVRRTFNRITVDGDTSTNDMVVVLANGASGCAPIHPGTSAYEIFGDHLEIVLKKLALDIVRDGEGATKLVEITVIGAASEEDATKAAKTLALSPLLKTAIHGEDANWGRVVAAVGYSGIDFTPEDLELIINGRPILHKNFTEALSISDANKALSGDTVELVVNLNGGNGTATVWTCDLSAEYVAINGSYRS